MDDQCSPLTSWSFYYPEEGMEEYLKHSLLYTTLELENTVLSAREELARKDDELEHLKILLTRTTKERDEAVSKCQRLMLEKLLLQQQKQINESVPPPSIGNCFTMASDESYADGFCSSDYDENGINPASEIEDFMEKLEPRKPLPEKGKFLQAVMEAGPLLNTLLLAGPLPQWQHPPPHLSSVEIPPVTICVSPRPRLLHQDSCLSTARGGGGGGGGGEGCFNLNNKRVLSDSDLVCDSSPTSKHQRVVHQSSLTPASIPLLS